MPRPLEKLKNMKLPTAAPQEPNPKKRPSGSQHGPDKRIPRQVGQSAKFQAAKPIQQLISKLADFKLSKPLLTRSKKVSENKARGKVSKSDPAVKNVALELDSSRSESVVSAETSALTVVPSRPSTAKNVRIGNVTLPFIKESKGSRFVLHLLLVKPWFLLAGFWVFSLLGAGLAFEGMISPQKLKMALPEAAEVTPADSENAFIKVEPSAEEQPIKGESDKAKSLQASPQAGEAEGETAAVAALEDTQTAANSSGFPAGPLVALVGTCAVGCLVISRRRAMMRIAAARSRSRARRVGRPTMESKVFKSGQKSASANKTAPMGPMANPNKGGVRKVARPSVAKPSAATSISQPVAGEAGGQSAAVQGKKRRHRNKRTTTSDQSGQGGRAVLISRSTAQQAAAGKSESQTGSKAATAKSKSSTGAPVTKTIQRRRLSSSRSASRRQGVVSVVPASESNALDWSDGSLAHQLDVRPQRTASM